MDLSVIRAVERLLRPLKRRVLLMVGRAVLLLLDDTARLQALQVEGLTGETLDALQRIQQYGFTSNPHPGAECIVLSLGGARQHSIVIAADDRRYRPTGLPAGAVCHYTSEDDPDGDGGPHRVTLLPGREIRLDAGSARLSLEPTGMTLTLAGGRTRTWSAG